MKQILLKKIIEIENKEEFSFSVKIALSFVLVTLFCTSLVIFFNMVQVQINLNFIVASGFMGMTEILAIIEDYIFKDAFWLILLIFLWLLVVFVFGFYLSKIMIRPFKIIALNCHLRREGIQIFYSPDLLSDLPTLTRFSLFFFKEIENAIKMGGLKLVEIPKQFTGIHKPIIERNFFFNYFLIILIFCVVSSYCLVALNLEIRDLINELVTKLRLSNQSTAYFIDAQNSLANTSLIFFVFLHAFAFLGLGIYLYSKISTPAFAVFATLRSFLKGNYHNRIHLVGYTYLRHECRIINKYLEYIQKELTQRD